MRTDHLISGKTRFIALILVSAALLLVGCNPSTPAPTATAAPTDTPAPTATPTAVPTPTEKPAQAYYEDGVKLLDAEKYEEAIAEFDKAIARDATLGAAYRKRGNAYGSLNQLEKAKADFSKAIEVAPTDPAIGEAYYNLALAYAKGGDEQKAIEYWTKAIEIKHEEAKVYYNRGKSYYNLKEYEQAKADLTKATELDPKSAEAYSLLGRTMGNLDKIPEAILDFSRAIELDPNLAEAYFYRAVWRTKIAKESDYAALIADFGMALKLSDDANIRQQAQTALQNAYKNLKDPALRQQAAQALGLAAEAAPASPEAVVQAIFDAAKNKDFAKLPGLCDPQGQNDADTALICAITATHPKKDSFVQNFATGKISGKAVIKGDQAQVPFLFGPKGDTKETMNLILRNGQWYLFDF